jgi:hypothetical protein
MCEKTPQQKPNGQICGVFAEDDLQMSQPTVLGEWKLAAKNENFLLMDEVPYNTDLLAF